MTHVRTLLAVVFLGLAACATSAPETDPPAPPVLFAVRFTPGPAWVAGKPPQEQPGIGPHIANMEAWKDRGIVVMGGPFLDGTGGMAVLRTQSAEEAKRLAHDDPGVRSGLFVPEVHPWLCVYMPGD